MTSTGCSAPNQLALIQPASVSPKASARRGIGADLGQRYHPVRIGGLFTDVAVARGAVFRVHLGSTTGLVGVGCGKRPLGHRGVLDGMPHGKKVVFAGSDVGRAVAERKQHRSHCTMALGRALAVAVDTVFEASLPPVRWLLAAELGRDADVGPKRLGQRHSEPEGIVHTRCECAVFQRQGNVDGRHTHRLGECRECNEVVEQGL